MVIILTIEIVQIMLRLLLILIDQIILDPQLLILLLLADLQRIRSLLIITEILISLRAKPSRHIRLTHLPITLATTRLVIRFRLGPLQLILTIRAARVLSAQLGHVAAATRVFRLALPQQQQLLLVGPAVLVAVVHVLAVGAAVREALAALAARERLLARVQPLVLGQVVLVLEGLVARVADEGPNARVLVLVARQRGLLGEHLVALVARVHVLVALGVHVALPALASLSAQVQRRVIAIETKIQLANTFTNYFKLCNWCYQ